MVICKVGEVHPCMKTVTSSPRDVRRVIKKSGCSRKLLSTEGQSKVLEWCCSAGSEDRFHFIAVCTTLSSVRQSYISSLDSIFTLVNVNAPVVATTSWWLHFSAQVVA